METDRRADTVRLCGAWVGLEPPTSVDCNYVAGHEGLHQGTLQGSVRDGRGGYEDTLVLIQWAAQIDGDG